MIRPTGTAGEHMETIYQLNADDLNEDFLEGLKASFKHKEIEIVVYERDETAYLLRSPANRDRLVKAIADIEKNRNIVVPDQEQFQ
jgi:antitoxin YefM